MTRKQAISQAITILSYDANNKEIVSKLQEILLEMPLSSWTKASIIDSIESYAIEHDNTLPPVTELKSKNKLPSNTVINAKFKISSMDVFYKTYFKHLKPQNKSSSLYRNEEEDFFQKVFKENYLMILEKLGVKYVDIKTYDKYKNRKTPHSSTIIKNCDCHSYDDLLIMCGFKKAKIPISSSLKISYNDEEDIRDISDILSKTQWEGNKK